MIHKLIIMKKRPQHFRIEFYTYIDTLQDRIHEVST